MELGNILLVVWTQGPSQGLSPGEGKRDAHPGAPEAGPSRELGDRNPAKVSCHSWMKDKQERNGKRGVREYSQPRSPFFYVFGWEKAFEPISLIYCYKKKNPKFCGLTSAFILFRNQQLGWNLVGRAQFGSVWNQLGQPECRGGIPSHGWQ